MSNGKKSRKLSMRLTLILFSIIPMTIVTIIISVLLATNSSAQLKKSTLNSMLALAKQTGSAFDYSVDSCETVMQAYTKAPIVQEYLKNPSDATLAKKAQQYTVEYFGMLDGWEGIYLADWNSKVLTHPVEAVVGRTMREGDSLKALQDAMLGTDGVYNVGVITSPASGTLIISMYAAIYDSNNKPIGYVGAGIPVSALAPHFSDVSALGLDSAYVYFVDNIGTMLYHPDESKIGNMVENAAVKGVVARLENGESPEPATIVYEYKEANKYAAYYVGDNNAYIAVVTADEGDVLAEVNRVVLVALIVCIISLLVFVVLVIIVAKYIAAPLTAVAKAMDVLGTGDISVDCKAKSVIKETDSIIGAFSALKGALNNSMSHIKDSAEVLQKSIVSVDTQTTNNVDAVSQISNAIDEVAHTSQAVAENAQEMAGKAIELESSIEMLSENVSGLHNSSLSIRKVNEEANAGMKSVYDSANESVEAVQDIASKITETNEAIANIESALQAIESIAAQTNLLSLNASIEAARAGEAGSGFAVVAGEIRTLADSSAESAKEIKQIIGNVINLSKATVDISNHVFEVIDRQQKDIELTQQKFKTLSDAVESSISEIGVINDMADTLDDIKKQMINATTELGAISEELGASAEEVASSCQTVMSACMDTQESTREMREVNESMSEAIEFFKL